MNAVFAAQVSEFEVLVDRAARCGRLQVAELVDSYRSLLQQGPDTERQARCVDLDGVVLALQALPQQLFVAKRVLLVPHLFAADSDPAEPGGASAGRVFRTVTLADGTAVCEVPHGRTALMEWALHVCHLVHEAGKAQALLAAAHAETGQADVITVYADTPQPGAGGVYADTRTASVPPLESGAGATPSYVELAFAWGHDPRSLQAAVQRSGGLLLERLLETPFAPQVTLHPGFAPQAQHTAQRAVAAAMVTSLAEHGLLDRPLHLWLGPHSLVDCLSPYSRDLRPYLLAWAASGAPGAPSVELAAAPVGGPAGEDALYALAQRFVGADSRLLAEKQAAERSVGIYHHRLPGTAESAATTAYQVVDLGRIDTALCDVRLPAWKKNTPQPVLLCIEAPEVAHYAALVEHLLDSLGDKLCSISAVCEGTVLQVTPAGQMPTATGPQPALPLHAAIALPQMQLRHGGGGLVALPGDGLSPADFVSLTERPAQTGVMLCTASLLLSQRTWAAHFGAGYAGLLPSCVQAGWGNLVEVLQQAVLTGRLQATADINWAIVSRPDSELLPATLQLAPLGSTAVAVAALRRITGAVGGSSRRGAQAAAAAQRDGPPPDRHLTPLRTTSWGLRVKV
jgi:hypothetical protein